MVRLLTLAVVVFALLGAPVALGADHPQGDRVGSGTSQVDAAKPNIVVIYLDDTNPHDGRLWSDPEITPTLYDMFVAHGVQFENAVVETPLCCPGRAGLLTGLHTYNHRVFKNDIRLFNPNEHIGKELKAVGYETMLIGKYFNHPNYLTDNQWATSATGWTNLDAIRNASDPNFNYYYNYTFFTKQGNVSYPSNVHLTQAIAERAVARLQAASPTAPVFALLTPYDTHYPNLPMAQFAGNSKCDTMPPWKPANYNEADVSDKPSYIRYRALLPHAAGWPMVQMCKEMRGIDWMVKQVKDKLENQGRLDNTLFVLAADNGMGWGQHRSGNEKQTPYAAPIPLYMSFPARWGSQARTITDAVANIDLAPTFCDLADCTLGPYATGQTKPDGTSLLPLLDGNVTGLSRKGVLEQNFQKRPFAAIRTSPSNPLGFWHYVEYASGERELYDLSGGVCSDWRVGMPGDPCELENRAADPSLSDLRATLHARIASLLAEGRELDSPQRPDGSVAITSVGTFKGLNVYATIPKSSQTQKIRYVLKNSVNDFSVRVTNHGSNPATYLVHGNSWGSSTMSVRYFAGVVDVTSQVNAGTYSLTNVAPGNHADLLVRVIVGNAPVLAKRAAVLTLSLQGGPATQIDVLKVVAVR